MISIEIEVGGETVAGYFDFLAEHHAASIMQVWHYTTCVGGLQVVKILSHLKSDGLGDGRISSKFT